MTEKIDRKFRILAVNPCNGKIYTDDNAVLFVAKDAALSPMLRFYHDECRRLGCEEEHLESIRMLIVRVDNFQKKEKRLPDTKGECELTRCIGGVFEENKP